MSGYSLDKLVYFPPRGLELVKYFRMPAREFVRLHIVGAPDDRNAPWCAKESLRYRKPSVTVILAGNVILLVSKCLNYIVIFFLHCRPTFDCLS